MGTERRRMSFTGAIQKSLLASYAPSVTSQVVPATSAESTSTYDSTSSLVINLRRHSNVLIPISRLPPETLLAIFAECSDDDTQDVLWKASWLPLTHVCHDWRATALNAPTLWCRVVVGRTARSEALKTWLNRSREAALSVAVKASQERYPYGMDIHEGPLACVFGEIRRIRKLSIVVALESLALLEWPERCPMLQELELTNLPGWPNRSELPSPFLQILYKRTPSIQSLSINEYHFDFKTWVLPATLSRLFVRDRGPSTGFTLYDILRALRGLPLLEESVLHHILPIGLSAPPGILPERVALSSLRHINLRGRAREQLLLLELLDFQPSVRLDLSLELGPNFQGLSAISLAHLSTHLSRNAPLKSAVLTVDRDIWCTPGDFAVGLKAWWKLHDTYSMSSCKFQGDSAKIFGNTADVSISLRIPWDDVADDMHTWATFTNESSKLIQDLFAVLPLSKVASFAIDIPEGPYLQGVKFYHSMKELHSLCVFVCPALGEYVLELLDSSDTDGTPIFPKLHALLIAGVDFNQMHDRFKSLLQKRRDVGATIELTLEECYDVQASYVEDLQGVARVRWDGLDQPHEVDTESLTSSEGSDEEYWYVAPFSSWSSRAVAQADIVANMAHTRDAQARDEAANVWDADASSGLSLGTLEQRRKANTMIPISRLSGDTLLDIFEECVSSTDKISIGLWKASWIPLTHVCHHWRFIAIESAILWQKVLIGPNVDPEALRTWLARSGQVPLKLALGVLSLRNPQPFTTFQQPVYDCIAAELSRIGDLNLYGDRQALMSLTFPCAATSLQTLLLCRAPTPLPFDVVLGSFPQSLRQCFPSLRSLHVSYYPFDFKNWVLPSTLTSLDIRNFEPPSTSTLHDILQALQALPLLEVLALEHGIPVLHDIPSIGISERVALPCLRHLRLLGFAPEQLLLLNSLEIPPSTKFYLDLLLYKDFSELSTLTLAHLSTCLGKGLILQSAAISVFGGESFYCEETAFRFKVWRELQAVEDMDGHILAGADGADVNINVIVDEPDEELMEERLSDESLGLIKTFFAPLPLSNITSFCMDCYHGPYFDADEVYRSLRNVRTFGLFGWYDIETDVVELLDTTDDDGNIVFPRLNALFIQGIDFGKILPRFKAFLEKRRDANGPIQLTLRCCYDLDASSVGELKDVALVTWDGVEQQDNNYDEYDSEVVNLADDENSDSEWEDYSDGDNGTHMF
ncbi:hypothetical protein NM688_g1224 [Phlebia brevispora]|uniref:Uncharacterized protein n=1 Tax=Phlebia brevispora TaxID=194682 RepID=A0ACC1TCF7_9APHY|nr:hypothetical protein NM688_g1224 [Phlebia brevispora]